MGQQVRHGLAITFMVVAFLWASNEDFEYECASDVSCVDQR